MILERSHSGVLEPDWPYQLVEILRWTGLAGQPLWLGALWCLSAREPFTALVGPGQTGRSSLRMVIAMIAFAAMFEAFQVVTLRFIVDGLSFSAF